jgi:hypothetical protein
MRDNEFLCRERAAGALGGGNPEASGEPNAAMPPGYHMTAAGVLRRAADPEKPDLHVCGPLAVVAATHDGTGHAWGVLLRWPDKDGTVHEWAMPLAMLAGDGTEVRARLLDRPVRRHRPGRARSPGGVPDAGQAGGAGARG